MKKHDLKRRFYLLGLLGLGLLIIAAPSYEYLAPFNEHAPHLAIAFLIIGFIAYVKNNRDVLLTSLGLSSLVFVMLMDNSESGYSSRMIGKNEESINVSLINLSSINNEEELKRVLFEDQEVICFIEVTPTWNKILKSYLGDRYAHSFNAPAIDIFGKSLYSKHAIINIDTIPHALNNDFEIGVRKKDSDIKIILTHIIPDLDQSSKILTQKQLSNLSQVVLNSNHPTIILGEFNQVHWSKNIKEFKSASLINNCRKESSLTQLNTSMMMAFHNAHLSCQMLADLNNNISGVYGIKASYRLDKHYIIGSKL